MAETANQAPAALDGYLREHIAPRFRDLVNAAEQKVTAAQHELEDLRAATGTMLWEVASPTPTTCFVNIANGEMKVEDHPLAEPFITISQSEADWGRFTAGVAQTGFLSGQVRRPLGRSRIERLRRVKGALRFVLTGLPNGGAWTFTLCFGSGPRPAEPQTTITVPAELVPKIQSGQIDPQLAFMQGQLKISGDLSLAMQLGMALFT
jgi:putative sterol carrier protein